MNVLCDRRRRERLSGLRLARAVAAVCGAGLVWGAAGCSPGWYQRDADLQMDRILRERKQQTLAYEPSTDVANAPTPDAPGTPYVRVPISPIPVASGEVLEPAVVEAGAGALGPVNVVRPGQEIPTVQDYRSSVRDRPSVEPPVLGPPSPERAMERMDLFGALRFAVRNSRDYADQMENLYLRTLDVTLERHLLSPRPFVSQTVDFSQNGRDVDYSSALSATTNAGVRQRLPYGGELVAQSLVTFVDALQEPVSNGESAQVSLSASLPLLRGAGFVNLEGLVRSERELVYAVRTFETYRRAFLVDVSSRYFNLLTARSGVLNRRAQLDSQLDLVERSRALFAAGKGTFLDVQRSLNSQIQGETQLIQAEEVYRSALDNFKVFIGMDPEKDLEIVPVELDVSIPEIEQQDAVKLAQLYRLDLRTAKDRIDDARRAVDNAKNGLLPDLSLTGSVASQNFAGTPAAAVNSETTDYRAGARLDLPVDRVAERNAYRRSMIFLQQAQRDYEQARDVASVAARSALRQIRSARDRVELNRRNVQIAQSRLDLANSLLRQPLLNPLPGLSSSNRDVVEAQQSLLQAQDALDQARAALQIQVLSYYRDTGTLRIDPSAGALGRAMARERRPVRE